MKKLTILLLFVYLSMTIASVYVSGYKRFKADPRYCITDNNRGVINKALEIRMRDPGYVPASHHHRNILKLYEECIKSGEGFRFKKAQTPTIRFLYR